MTKNVSDRILSDLRYKNLKCERAQGFIRVLIEAFEGKPLYFYSAWNRSCGRYSLQRRGYTESVLIALRHAGVAVVTGNNSPHGGALGDFFRCKRRNLRAAAALRALLVDNCEA